MERWEPINGTNGQYFISDHGMVRSANRILRLQEDNKGYFRIRLTVNKDKRTYKVHRLVAQHFLCNKENKPQVNHLDGNKKNNHYKNLEWATNKGNAKHAIENGLWENVFKASNAENKRRMKPIIATDIKTGEVKRFGSVSEAEKTIQSRHVTSVLKGKRMHAKGYAFSYAQGVV